MMHLRRLLLLLLLGAALLAARALPVGPLPDSDLTAAVLAGCGANVINIPTQPFSAIAPDLDGREYVSQDPDAWAPTQATNNYGAFNAVRIALLHASAALSTGRCLNLVPTGGSLAGCAGSGVGSAACVANATVVASFNGLNAINFNIGPTAMRAGEFFNAMPFGLEPLDHIDWIWGGPEGDVSALALAQSVLDAHARNTMVVPCFMGGKQQAFYQYDIGKYDAADFCLMNCRTRQLGETEQVMKKMCFDNVPSYTGAVGQLRFGVSTPGVAVMPDVWAGNFQCFEFAHPASNTLQFFNSPQFNILLRGLRWTPYDCWWQRYFTGGLFLNQAWAQANLRPAEIGLLYEFGPAMMRDTFERTSTLDCEAIQAELDLCNDGACDYPRAPGSVPTNASLNDGAYLRCDGQDAYLGTTTTDIAHACTPDLHGTRWAKKLLDVLQIAQEQRYASAATNTVESVCLGVPECELVRDSWLRFRDVDLGFEWTADASYPKAMCMLQGYDA